MQNAWDFDVNNICKRSWGFELRKLLMTSQWCRGCHCYVPLFRGRKRLGSTQRGSLNNKRTSSSSMPLLSRCLFSRYFTSKSPKTNANNHCVGEVWVYLLEYAHKCLKSRWTLACIRCWKKRRGLFEVLKDVVDHALDDLLLVFGALGACALRTEPPALGALHRVLFLRREKKEN